MVPCEFQQGEKDLCLYFSFASALHYIGYVEEAKRLAKKATLVLDLEPMEQISNLKKDMIEICPSIAQTQAFGILCKKNKKKKVMSMADLLLAKTIYPTVVVPEATDFQTSHAVCVVDDLIFDSTQSFALKLQKKSMDWICGKKLECHSVRGALRFYQKISRENVELCRDIQTNR
jgi:hypothetical protein